VLAVQLPVPPIALQLQLMHGLTPLARPLYPASQMPHVFAVTLDWRLMVLQAVHIVSAGAAEPKKPDEHSPQWESAPVPPARLMDEQAWHGVTPVCRAE